MGAEDLFGGDEFPVPASVAKALASMGAESEVPQNSWIIDPNQTLVVDPRQTPAFTVEQAASAGVWVTFEADAEAHAYTVFTDVRVHESELEALRAAVGQSGYTARFLKYGQALEDVL